MINKLTDDDLKGFTPSTLQDYTIQSSGQNSCGGNEGSGFISAIPDDTNVYPTFILATNTDELSYSFKGQVGTNYSDCLGLICSYSNNNFKAGIIGNPIVDPVTYFERNCSAYVLVDGPKWNDAQANAESIGGDLATINDAEENEWIANTYRQIGKDMNRDRYNTRNLFIGLKRGGATGEKVTNGAGYSDGWVSGEDSQWRPPYWGQTGEIKDADGNIQGTNLEGHQGGADYSALNVMDGFTTCPTCDGMTWNDFPEWMHEGKGMAEIPIPGCDK